MSPESDNGGFAGTATRLMRTMGVNLRLPRDGAIPPLVRAGVAAPAGMGCRPVWNGALRAEMRLPESDPDALPNRASTGTTNIDPVVFGRSCIHGF